MIYKQAVVISALVAGSAMAAGGHQHGVGQLEMALEGNRLDVALIAPAADISRLPESLLSIQGGACQSTQITQSSTAAGGAGHADVTLTTRYDCTDAAAIRSIQLSALNDLSTLEKIEYVFLSEWAQKFGRLTRSSDTIRFE